MKNNVSNYIQVYRSALNNPTHSPRNAALVILTLLLLLSELYVVKVVKDSKEYESYRVSAASPDQLEVEDAVLGGNASVVIDSNASGGKYVVFGGFNIIAGPSSQDITQNSAKITWTLSEPATGKIEYGTTALYGNTSPEETSFDYSTHAQTLSGLSAGTVYHYRVRSKNQGGAEIVSTDNTFTTLTSSSAPTPTSSAPNPSIPAGAINVPDSVDSSGGSDVSSQISSIINNAPNGSTIVFKQNGTYQMGHVLQIYGKTGITLEGNGATLKLTGPRGYDGAGIFLEPRNVNTTIRNLKIVGNWDQADTNDSCCANEGQHGIAAFGSDNTVIDNVDVSWIGGDCFYVEPGSDDLSRAPDGYTVRNSSCSYAGRHGAAIEAGRNILIENSQFDKMGMYFIDIEPGSPSYNVDGLIIRNNHVANYGTDASWDPYFVGICDAPWNSGGSTVKNVTVSGNTVERAVSALYGVEQGLHTIVCGESGVKQNFTFTNNRSNSAVPADSINAVMYFRSVNGVTVTGNVQPVNGNRTFATFPGSSNVTYDQ